jgi:hypothetical protein
MLYRLSAATMPHLLIRLASGDFYFGPANGTYQPALDFTPPKWGDRTAGDYDTAPDPSFIGYPIQAVFIHRNRLGLLADESQILSRAKSFFDFFPETVTTVLDTDPIDLAASSNKVSVLRHAVSSQDELILWSDQLQFRSASSGQSLTPATAAIAQLTAYECDSSVAPLQVAGGIVFAQTNGTWTQFREFALRGVCPTLNKAIVHLHAFVCCDWKSVSLKLCKKGLADRQIWQYKSFYPTVNPANIRGNMNAQKILPQGLFYCMVDKFGGLFKASNVEAGKDRS